MGVYRPTESLLGPVYCSLGFRTFVQDRNVPGIGWKQFPACSKSWLQKPASKYRNCQACPFYRPYEAFDPYHGH